LRTSWPAGQALAADALKGDPGTFGAIEVPVRPVHNHRYVQNVNDWPK
jgi:hypothetical protein